MKKIISAILALCLAAGVLCVLPVRGTDGDPASSYTHTDAADEDSGVDLWFDYASEKRIDTDTRNTGRMSASAYMAKNEIEDIQFVLAVNDQTARNGLTAVLGGFHDSEGNTLDAEIFIELYHDCDSYGNVPDAIPPLSAYGSFDLEVGKAQSFIIKITSVPETVSGWYNSSLSVLDGNGNEIKTTEVFAYVWDFELSESTACATSMNLDYNYLRSAYISDGMVLDGAYLYKNYYDYLLENRICAYYLPSELTEDLAYEYMDNPRVTSFQADTDLFGSKITGKSYLRMIYKDAFLGEENAHRFEKAYYFSEIVDADEAADLEALKAYYDKMCDTFSSVKPDYTDKYFYLITTYINDIDYITSDNTVIDQIDYYDDFINHWCSKTFAYTSEEELRSVPGAKVMQPLKWNSVYGTFSERMSAMRERGDKVWWFISWDVTAPYINYYMQTDGVAQRILFWQQFDNDVQGFLYNFANFWLGSCSDPYSYNITNSMYPDAHGESILIYPGSRYGLDTPVGSLRLEAMRDGIEDFQMFTMLEEILGEGAADSYIDVMTTGMVTYSTSDEDYYNTRISLGNALEIAVNSEPEPDPEPDPEPIIPGDINDDGLVNLKDSYLLKKILLCTYTPNDKEKASADINSDGSINPKDSALLKKILLNAD